MAKEKLLTGLTSEESETANTGDAHPKFIPDRDISRISDFTRKTRCIRWSITMTVLVYVAAAVYLIYEGTTDSQIF